ncbi:MAG: DNA-binding protein, partial [Planctomycetia bacterium]|nr:DNA-binding protein [Planctomycetia bacterium]
MAGKFLSLEESARQLGVSVDEVQHLVDRKRLFPMRDGATIKFKADDVERLARELADEAPQADGLSLDLDDGSLSGGADVGDLVLGDAVEADVVVFDDGNSLGAASHTMVRGGEGSGLSLSGVGGGEADVGIGGSGVGGDAAANDDLLLESVVGASSIGASSPSLAGAGLSGVTGGPGQ